MMNAEAQRIAIASVHRPELVKEHEDAERLLEKVKNGVYPIIELEPFPDYLNDLNAIREAERTIREKPEWLEFVQHLSTICGQWNVIHATASQRAEAFLKTIGKWEY